MTDPVAEAAANLAKQQSEPSLLDKAMDTIHDLEAKVEHLIHPEAESVPNVTPGSPAIDASATLLDVSGQPIMSSDSAKPSESLPMETPMIASTTESAEPSTITPTSSAESEAGNPGSESNLSGTASIENVGSGGSIPEVAAAELPNVLPASTSGIAHASEPSAITGSITSSESAEVPNAVSAAVESTTDTASVTSASGSGETSSIGASSAEPPLHMRVANHLEAIYSMVKAHVDAVPTAAVADTSALKTHVGDILHRISNGMQVTQGELVQKLETLYRML